MEDKNDEYLLEIDNIKFMCGKKLKEEYFTKAKQVYKERKDKWISCQIKTGFQLKKLGYLNWKKFQQPISVLYIKVKKF